MDRMPDRARCRNTRSQIGEVPDGSCGLTDGAQLSHGAWITAEHIGPRTPAAAQHADLGRRVSLYRQSDSLAEGSGHYPGQARALCAPRPAPMPGSTGLVQGLYLDICLATGRGQQRDHDVNELWDAPTHAARLARRPSETMRRSSGRHDPHSVPHFSAACSASSAETSRVRWRFANPATKSPISDCETFQQLQTILPRVEKPAGATTLGAS